MPLKYDRKVLESERRRLTRFQHQHRGLRFVKVWLPPENERKVHIIGHNNHVYKGQIPTVPLDQLPPEVDPDSIEEEQLYQEIRDMKFPLVPPQEPLGPSRRVGGEYTMAKRLQFAPVRVYKDEERMSIPILGADGKVYRGTSKRVPVFDLDKKLRGSKRPVRTPATYSSDREAVEPTVVSLYVDGKSPEEIMPQVPLIGLPIADLNKMIRLVRKEEHKKHRELPPEKDSKAEDEKEEGAEEPSKEAEDEKETSGETEDEEEPSEGEAEDDEEPSEGEAEDEEADDEEADDEEETSEPEAETEDVVEPEGETEEALEPEAETESTLEPEAAAESEAEPEVNVEPGAEAEATIE